MHLLGEEVTVGSGPGRGCRWPWSWDSILTQGTGLSIFPFLRKFYPYPFNPPMAGRSLGRQLALLALGGYPVPTGLFLPLQCFFRAV